MSEDHHQSLVIEMRNERYWESSWIACSTMTVEEQGRLEAIKLTFSHNLCSKYQDRHSVKQLDTNSFDPLCWSSVEMSSVTLGSENFLKLTISGKQLRN